VADEVVAAGLAFPAAVVSKIRARIADDNELTRTELSREVCQWQDWRAPNGRLREMACRLALLELEKRGEIALPERRSAVRTTMAAERWPGIDDRPLRCELREQSAASRAERNVVAAQVAALSPCGPLPNNSMQRTALRAAADAER
jgi:hypothetical protein